ncbi:MAG: hypothetical protein ACREPG_06605, partial [Candidatus Binatia bacterium]
TEGVSGVAYRPLTPCDIVLSGNNMNLQSTLYLPDKSALNIFPINRGAFIKKVTTVTFDNGVLTEFTITKPSEALGFISIPVDLAKAIVSIPGEVLSVKVKREQDTTALVQAQKTLLDAQEALRKAQQSK